MDLTGSGYLIMGSVCCDGIHYEHGQLTCRTSLFYLEKTRRKHRFLNFMSIHIGDSVQPLFSSVSSVHNTVSAAPFLISGTNAENQQAFVHLENPGIL